MDHMQLSDELRQQLLESAAWTKVGIEPVKRIEEETKEEEVSEAKEEKKEEVVEVEKEEEVVAEEAHVCPLCVSQLQEAIDEERVLEHLDVVLTLVDRLSQINESEDDVDAIIDEAIKEVLLQNKEEE